MKLKYIPALLILAALLTSCSFDSKKVAVYKHGDITLGEVKKRAGKAELTLQLKKTIIESLAIEGIARHDALAAGYDKDELLLLRLENETWPLLKKLVNEKMGSGAELSREYVKCRVILFSGGLDGSFKEAERAIGLLDKGAKFDSLLKSYSDNPKNVVESNTLYVVKGGAFPELEETLFGFVPGSYTKSPVVMKNGSAGVFISDGKGTLTSGNIKDKVETERERKRITAMFERISYSEFIKRLEENNMASFKVGSLPEKDSAVLFTVSGKDYTFGEMKKRLDLFSRIIREPLRDKKFLFNFAREWYFHELYRSESLKSGLVNDEKFAAQMNSSTDFILANDYIRHLCEKNITVTEREMRDEYSKNRKRYMKRPDNGSKKPVQLSYSDAKVFIKKKMIQARVAESVTLWRKKTLAESGLVIQ